MTATDVQRLLAGLRQEVRELRAHVDLALARIGTLENAVRCLEGQTPQAGQAQYEADLAAADLAESGYDRHGRGCDCPECYEPEPEEYDPGPEADDEGGMSEYRHALPSEEF